MSQEHYHFTIKLHIPIKIPVIRLTSAAIICLYLASLHIVLALKYMKYISDSAEIYIFFGFLVFYDLFREPKNEGRRKC